MVQQNYQEETTNSKNPLWHGIHHKERENLNGDSHGDRKEFRLEETKYDEGISNDFGLTQKLGKNFVYRHHDEPKVQQTCREKNHSLFLETYIIECKSSDKKFSMREEGLREAKTSEAKTNSIVYDIAGKGRNSVLYYKLCAIIRSDGKIWRQLFT